MSITSRLLLRRVLFGEDALQQLRSSLTLLALALYCAFTALLWAAVQLGLSDWSAAWPLMVFSLSGAIAFYAVARGRWSMGWIRNRTLAIAQQLWAQGAICGLYAITGPARGAVLLLVLLLMLYGVFTFTPRVATALASSALGLLAALMVWKALRDPLDYPPRVEAAHLMFLFIVLGGCAAVSVQIARLRGRLQNQRDQLSAAVQRIQTLATRDELTGLLNRRAVSERLQELAAARVHGHEVLSVGLVDLDHFKRINDSLGHAVGDEVLKRFAAIAMKELRVGDLLARWGGEEFLLVQPSGSVRGCVESLRRIGNCLRQTNWGEIAPGLVVTFSAGVAERAVGSELESAIGRADAAMYAAKRSGRDRICVAPADAAPADPGSAACGSADAVA